MDSKLNEGSTEFPGDTITGGERVTTGKFFTFFKRFFPIGKNQGKKAKVVEPTLGDARPPAHVLSQEEEKGSFMGYSGRAFELPENEKKRKARYQVYEKMDEYPEISSAFDIYGDDASQEDIDGRILSVDSEYKIVKEELEIFKRESKIESFMWDICRNVVKYGDCFVELIVDIDNPGEGIKRLKVLNPNHIYRFENKYGILTGFAQRIPDDDIVNNYMADSENGKMIKLHKEQICHFRRRTSDNNHYPYGKGVAAAGIQAWRSLRLMEDGMLIYRLSRAPERRAFKIEVGNLPASKVDAFMERTKQKFKKEKFYDMQSNTINERFNPASFDEDFFIPVRNGKGSDITVLPAAQNLGEIDDVKYFRDKLLASMKVPKDFIVEKDKSPERKANLSQLDMKFSKAVSRVQADVTIGLMEIFTRHLLLKGVNPVYFKNLKLVLCPPSDMHQKRRLELDAEKTNVIQQILGTTLFDDEYVYKVFYGMSDEEVSEMRNRVLEYEKRKLAMQQAAQPQMAGGMPGMGGMGMPGGGMPMAGGQPGMGGPLPPESGVQNASAESTANAGQESKEV
jgi:hypothetical protein